MTVLTLEGHCPSKKNLWRRGKAGRMFIDEETKAQIERLTYQANEQWIGKPTVHADVTVRFFVAHRRSDRDNMLTTVLDCLRDAGVIENDNIAKFNGTITVLPAQVAARERVVVEIL